MTILRARIVIIKPDDTRANKTERRRLQKERSDLEDKLARATA